VTAEPAEINWGRGPWLRWLGDWGRGPWLGWLGDWGRGPWLGGWWWSGWLDALLALVLADGL